MDDVDLDADSTYLLNKYFILPVLSLNTSVINLDSTVTSFNNSSSVIANTLSIIRLNASTLANTSSITIINASILANTSSITNLNTSVTNLNFSIANLNISTSANNVWTGTNNFSNALGVTTSWIDRLAAGILSIGTSLASSITLGAAAIPTNIKGALTVGEGANTIALNANSGLNQLLLTGNTGTSGQVLTSGGAAGSLSWAAGSGGVSLGGTNTWTAMNTFSNGLTMGGSNNITLGSGAISPTSTQLGYTTIDTTLNLHTSPGFNKVQGNNTFNMFTNGITLTAGSWLITYTVQFTSDNATTNWCNVFNTYLVRGATSTNYGTYVGAQVFNTAQKTTGYGTPISNNGDFRPSGSGVITVSITSTTTYNVQGFLALVSAQVGNFVLVPGNCNIVGTRIA